MISGRMDASEDLHIPRHIRRFDYLQVFSLAGMEFIEYVTEPGGRASEMDVKILE